MKKALPRQRERSSSQISPQEMKSFVTRAISQAGNAQPHESWIDPLRQQLSAHDETIVTTAIAAVASLSGASFDDAAEGHCGRRNTTDGDTDGCLVGVALHAGSLDDDLLDRLIGLYQDSGSPTASARAAQIIGAAKSDTQGNCYGSHHCCPTLRPRNCVNCCEFFNDR